ncbi:hypothetical protein C7377_0685 [Balneicella halophila]|uniref:Uncharacterized protein n=1 Tax=Balneicella halophila TaxID=1537566 RepID=A0A7L4USG4_BALHA|nr:DUF3352 domain-containing protein [Balneicella halophila]PVX52371.1 hypothetical protein C7377_0685 [Balneicella halophila]
MQKKHYILIGIAILLLAGLIYLIVSRPEGEHYEDIDTIIGVPINSELIIHIPDLEELLEKSSEKGVWQELNKWESIKGIQNLQQDFSQALSKPELSELLDDAQLTIATKITGRNSIEVSYIFPLESSNKKNHIEKLVQYFSKDYTISSREYSGFTLVHMNNNIDADTDYFYAFAKGLFVLSTSQISLEDALLQIRNNNSLLDKESFQQLKKVASSNDDLNIFINGVTFPKLLSLGLDKKYSRFIKELTDFTTQAGLDVNISEDKILLNGFLYSNTNDFFYTNLLLNQEPVKLNIEEIIPANTRFWSALSLSNEEAYLDNYKRYLEQTGDIKAYRTFSENFKNKTGVFPEDFIYPLLESEIGLIISEDRILNEAANRYCVLRTKSKSESTHALDSLQQVYATKQKRKLKTYLHKIDETLSYKMYEFPFSDFAHLMWGGLFFETKTNFCTLIDNYMVFGSSKESLERYIDFIVRRKTLKHDSFYQSQKKYWIDNESSFTAYSKNGDGTFFKKYAGEKLKNDISDKAKNLEKFPSMSIQVKNINNLLYVNGYISYTSSLQRAPETVWQSRLDNPLRMKPVMVTNHKSKERELIFQDTENILYLVSNSGRILWKLPLEEPIMGSIHQVDAYKNKKLQYLFNTKSKLYLIDRNGNQVGNFPIAFRSSATNPIALFDYDNNRNYRIFLSTEDKLTYLYDIKGKLVEGWKAEKNEHEVLQAVQYFVNASKDYIVYNDGYRNYILSRRGEVRSKPQKSFSKAENSKLCILESNSKQKCSLVATDETGLVYFTHLDGTVTTKEVGKFTDKHIFTSYDINVDGANDFIFIDKGILTVFNHSGKEIFNYDFKTEDVSRPNFYTFSSKDKKIGLRAGNNIYLFNSDGSIYDGFPLEGYSDFSIGFINEKDREFNLFVAGSNDLLYNYAVQ